MHGPQKTRATASSSMPAAGIRHSAPTPTISNIGTYGNICTVLPEDYQLNLSDFALFMSVMKVKEAYEDVLSIILDEPELKLKEVKTEQVVLNRSGKRAIRLDAWALDVRDRQFDMEMQNDTDSDDVFEKDLAMYTFHERCEEVPDLALDDGTCKIFLNMTSRNGRPELISLLQYMKHTIPNNPDIIVQDKRILDLDRIVQEVKQSEEWEAVKMNILEIGIAHGLEKGMEQGNIDTLKGIIENMLQHDMPDEDIKMYTGCEQNLIDKIKLKMNK